MIKGYKVFNSNWTCLEFQYELGKRYQYKGAIIPCVSGFHFCKKVTDCFDYYTFNPNNKVAEVVAHGKIIEQGNKIVTDDIEIIKEISWEELLTMVNIGKNNDGMSNIGDYNVGNYNTASHNLGDCNSGDCNTGRHNIGNYNMGHCNTGSTNRGSYNIGHHNNGNCNAGNYNIGFYNTGHYNDGDKNSGDWNQTKFSSGVFCTERPKLIMFNKRTDLYLSDWSQMEAKYILDKIKAEIWISEKNMTKEEKLENPSYKILGGYLKFVSRKEAAEKWHSQLTEEEISIIKALPNFNDDIFEEIVGVRL